MCKGDARTKNNTKPSSRIKHLQFLAHQKKEKKQETWFLVEIPHLVVWIVKLKGISRLKATPVFFCIKFQIPEYNSSNDSSPVQ